MKGDGVGMEPGIDMLVATMAENPRGLLNLARTLLIPRGHISRATAAIDQARSLAPSDPEIAAMAASMTGMMIDSWYFSMVQDEDRHLLYEQALARVLTPGAVVLDIGSGTGLFAMMAARAGAAFVVGCEQNPLVADAAREVVAVNNMTSRVRIINKSSGELAIGTDLPRVVDVILWDNLANNLLGAGCLPVLADAKRRLAKPDAVVLPASAELRVAMVEDLRPRDRAMDRAANFDLSPFNRFRKTGFTIKREQFVQRSDARTIAVFDAQAGQLSPPSDWQTQVISHGGNVNGIVQWLRFKLADGIFYETDAGNVTAFGHQFHHVPIQLTMAGEELTIQGQSNGQDDWFWITKGGLTRV